MVMMTLSSINVPDNDDFGSDKDDNKNDVDGEDYDGNDEDGDIDEDDDDKDDDCNDDDDDDRYEDEPELRMVMTMIIRRRWSSSKSRRNSR